MKSTILRSGVALACAVSLAACGGGGDLYLQGAVSGVTEDGLVLQNNGGNDLAVTRSADGYYDVFQFTNRISTDDTYNITVKSKPSNVADCTVNNATGHANYYTIQQISVVCTPKQHHLIVNVIGLTKDGLQLVNGNDSVTVAAGATSAKMADVSQDAPYGVKVLKQPDGQTCTVTGGSGTANNGSGTVGPDDVTNVNVTCS